MNRPLLTFSTLFILYVTYAPSRAEASLPLLSGATTPRAIRIVGGWPAIGASYWPTEHWGVGIRWRLPYASMAFSAGGRLRTQSKTGWYIEGQLAGSLAIPILTPGLALALMPGLEGGFQHHSFALWIGLKTSLVFQTTPPLSLVFPIRFVLGGRWQRGPWYIDLEASAGVDLQWDALPTAEVQVSVLVGWLFALGD